jgi:hypothetical protein
LDADRLTNNIALRLAGLLSILTLLAIAGAFGFMLTEDLDFFDALYFTIVTIGTVGYGDIHPTTVGGKVLAIFLIVVGVAIFLGVVASATQLLVQQRQERLRVMRTSMLIGLFFSELGSDLLRLCAGYDPGIEGLRQSIFTDGFLIDSTAELKKMVKRHVYDIHAKQMDLQRVKALLISRGDLLLRLIENTSFNEDEPFTELLRAIFHLREELLDREDLSGLPDTDTAHLAGDLKRIYPLLAHHWVGYTCYLKTSYAYLYSLALRENPFSPVKSVIIKK